MPITTTPGPQHPTHRARHWAWCWAWCLGAAALLGGILWATLRSDSAVADLAMPDAPPPATQFFAKSLAGTQPDGDLQAKPADHSADPESATLAYGELRRLFDYYLSTQGEQDLAAITQHLQTELDRRLGPRAAPPARRLLGLYLGYKRALVDLEAKPTLAGNSIDAIRQRMLAQQDLRKQYFSTDAIAGMFGFDDAMDADAVARLEISQNPGLNAEQKQKQLARVDATMPPALRVEREASLVVVRAEQRATDMRAEGASDDEVYRMRAQIFDAGAANRLAALDREEADWKRRIAVYLDARRQLLPTPTNAATATHEHQRALAQLQQAQFSEDERRRLAAYEPP